MKVVESPLNEFVLKTHHTALGNLYLFENLVIAEINEGMHLSRASADIQLEVIFDFYNNDKPFGYISNRINSFSVEVMDFPKFSILLENMKVFATVKNVNHRNLNIDIEVEKKFCKIPYQTFNNLQDAYDEINALIKSNSENINQKMI